MTVSTAARDARLAALLRGAADELDPKGARTTKAPSSKASSSTPKVTFSPSYERLRAVKAGKTTAAPVGGRSCESCGKGGLLTNTVCSKCRRAASKGNSTPPAAQGKRSTKAPKVSAKVTPEAPAKRTGRTSADQCTLTGCSIFRPATAEFCTKHSTKGARKAHKAAQAAK